MQTLIASRVWNPNECREWLNMLPYEGGNEFVNPNTLKDGQPAPDEPGGKETDQPDQPKRDAAYLRVLFGITARARDKAKRSAAFLEWIDGNLAPHRAEWSHVWGDKPFAFEELLATFRDVSGICTPVELPARIEAICTQWEKQ